MIDKDKKNLDLLRFYHKNSQDIQLKIKNTLLKGKIEKISFFFNTSIVLKMEDGNLIKIYLSDIVQDSIFPKGIGII